MNKVSSKPIALEPTTFQILTRNTGQSYRRRACAVSEMLPQTVTTGTSPWVFLVVFLGAAQYSAQLLCIRLIKHSSSVGHARGLHEYFVVFNTSLLCFSNELFHLKQNSGLQSYQPRVNEGAWAIKTSPPLALSFYFYHFYSCNRYKTGLYCVSVHLFDYC